jgi:hypothetical protein
MKRYRAAMSRIFWLCKASRLERASSRLGLLVLLFRNVGGVRVKRAYPASSILGLEPVGEAAHDHSTSFLQNRILRHGRLATGR